MFTCRSANAWSKILIGKNITIVEFHYQIIWKLWHRHIIKENPRFLPRHSKVTRLSSSNSTCSSEKISDNFNNFIAYFYINYLASAAINFEHISTPFSSYTNNSFIDEQKIAEFHFSKTLEIFVSEFFFVS